MTELEGRELGGGVLLHYVSEGVIVNMFKKVGEGRGHWNGISGENVRAH